MKDEQYMALAIEQAKLAASLGEVPVGAVLVHQGEVIAAGYNRREIDKDPLAHAELLCIKQASQALGGWRIPDATLYVTLEPCPMCAGGILNARIDRVVYGAKDPKAGSLDSVTQLYQLPYNWKPQVTGGVLEEDCAELLRQFFAQLRQRRKLSGKWKRLKKD
ncbi:MAG TPA: nucleoside deaminase [Candidatus Egerieicola faecale]|uniref:tRNA-specific adenosine deaminase n=1 Tax=Candidatus Egerieicola faecale TaxID=2840774 RepID=A0A9D1LKT4_9FIRM|nr:nucleoside deaminase [Candidatus Egerieicola faecale]